MTKKGGVKMKVNREILEKQLILTIEEIVTSKDFEPKKLDNIKERLYRRNILNANLLLNGNIPLNMASIEILYALSEAIYCTLWLE